jgi:16S rRNA G527 N7-methylase RsmG
MSNDVEFLTRDFLSNKEGEFSFLHAKNIDRSLGFKIPKIEGKLLQKYRAYDRYNDDSNRKQHYKGTQTWIGVHPQVLLTPYCDIYKALTLLNKVEINHVVDIGAAYGRVGIVLSVVAPNAKFTGYEIVKEREVEGNRILNRLGLSNATIERKNVLDTEFELPDADIYFIYDFSKMDDVYFILFQLSKKRSKKRFYLIARGDRIEQLLKKKFNHIWTNYITVDRSDFKIYY